jgi:hypothetical protein
VIVDFFFVSLMDMVVRTVVTRVIVVMFVLVAVGIFRWMAMGVGVTFVFLAVLVLVAVFIRLGVNVQSLSGRHAIFPSTHRIFGAGTRVLTLPGASSCFLLW